MKNLTLSFLIVLFTAFGVKAQTYYGSVNNFVVNSGWNVVPSSATTTINFTVRADRMMEATGNWNWKPFNMNFRIGLALAPGTALIEYLSPVYNISGSNFGQYSAFHDATFSFSVPSSKLLDDYHLVLYYNVPNNGSSYYQYYPSGATQINNPPPGPVFDPTHLAKIQSMGFSTSGIQNFNSSDYLVEGDVLLSKWYVDSFNGTTSTLANHSVNILLPNFIVLNSNTDWYGAYHNAIWAWNGSPESNIKLNVVFQESNIYNDAQPVDILIKESTAFTHVPVIAKFPTGNNKPGLEILINTNFRYPGNVTPTRAQMTWNIVHAIGHCLGLQHAKGMGSESSLMKQGTSTSSYTNELSGTYDSGLISDMYPLDQNSVFTPFINGSNNFPYTQNSNGYHISYYAPQLEYSWTATGINGTNYFQHYSDDYRDFLPEIGFNKGTYELRCVISGGKYLTPIIAKKIITVY